jgi:hypothetical protein
VVLSNTTASALDTACFGHEELKAASLPRKAEGMKK